MSNNLEIGTRVELLPGREDVYPLAYPASRGVISGTRKDKFGYPQVFVIWDQGHWRYNGEDNLWTFASHFQPVDDERELLDSEIYDVPSALPDPSTIPTAAQDAMMEDYMDSLITAADKASESDAFFFICMRRDEEGKDLLEMVHAAADERFKYISIADIFRFAEREMRRRGM